MTQLNATSNRNKYDFSALISVGLENQVHGGKSSARLPHCGEFDKINNKPTTPTEEAECVYQNIISYKEFKNVKN
ncbi:hypothetical protein BOH78_4996 [Pichia kudriavzevii]|uniref:Uncharacterized protein n=1 Tax=Pichia kudriavzevii TaxID=4909 RepID=A0A1V2LHU8_PICKU|nr:hypothetical protein BOH78_4996 [Pichia kudriavzevii]